MINILLQSLLIFGITMLSEALHAIIPLPIPTAVYGLVLLFLALSLKLIKLEQIRGISNFLITILPILFVAPVVNLMESWDLISGALVEVVVIMVATTIIVFAVTGLVTQAMCKKEDDHGNS
jgi:holin-like protein